MPLRGRVAVVVGAAYGVGPQIVDALIEAGVKVAVEAGDAATLSAQAARVARTSGWAEFFDLCERQVGPVDILVHSPQLVQVKPALELTRAETSRTIGDELIDVIDCVCEAARRMTARRSGRIVSLVSMSGKTGVHKGTAAMAAAKGGLIAFSRSLAAEVAPLGVTVNCVATALFEPQVASVSADHRAELTKGIPVGRFGRSIEAAHAVLYLAADEGGFVTGETLNLSGGRFMD